MTLKARDQGSILKFKFTLPMSNHKINIFKSFPLPLKNKEITYIARSVIKFEKIRKNCSFSIFFLNDKAVKKLNRRFRNSNRFTDVLSFAEFNCKTPLNGYKGFLGDIAISAERAKKVAQKYNNSYKTELTTYIIHGILHLLGYDDETPGKKIIMFKKQNDILNKV